MKPKTLEQILEQNGMSKTGIEILKRFLNGPYSKFLMDVFYYIISKEEK